MRRSRSRAVLLALAPLALLLGVLQPSGPALAQETPAAVEVAKESRALAGEGRIEAALVKAEEALALALGELGPAHPVTGFILDDLATLHYRQGRPADALPYAERAEQALLAAGGEGTVELAVVRGNRATVLTALGRFQDALPLYQEVHAVFLGALGRDHERTAQTARNLGLTLGELSRHQEARRWFTEALEARVALEGERSPAYARALLDRAGVDLRLEDLDAARRAANEAEAILSDAAPGDAAEALIMQARADLQESRLDAAEDRLGRALQMLEAAGRGEGEVAAKALYNQGAIHVLRREAVEAEQVYKRTLDLYRRQVGEDHPAVARVLHSLAIIYGNLDQVAEAERFFRRAIAIYRDNLGELDPSLAASRLELGLLLADAGRAEEAIAEAQAALRIFERLPEDQFGIKRAYATSSLGFGLKAAGRRDEAAAAFERATAMMAEIRGVDSSDRPPGLVALGEIFLETGDLARAEDRLREVIRIQEKDGARTGPALAHSLGVLAEVRAAAGARDEALSLMRRAREVMQGRLRLAGQALSSSAGGVQRAGRDLFERHLELALGPGAGEAGDALVTEMLEVAQLPHLTGTAEAVSRMAARFAAGDDALARRLRERQDALEAWRARDAILTTRLAEGRIDRDEADALRTELARLAERIERLDRDLRRDFPAFAELTDPVPVAASAVPEILKPGEALLLQVTGESATHLFLVEAEGVRHARTPLTADALEADVTSLKATLDLLGAASLMDLPDFDSRAAHRLYQGLVAPFADRLDAIRHLILVPDRAMRGLPPGLLLTAPAAPLPPDADFAGLDFLIEQLAVSIVPSLPALRGLRTLARASGASEPFIGFGDPDFEGGAIGGSRGVPVDLVFRNATEIDPRALATLPRLPDTADELYGLAASLGGSVEAVHLGPAASEATIRGLDLSRYRTIAFATHGLLAGDFKGLAEPALALSPPGPGAVGDGLLTASEVATLELDAELVVLSACNTAGPGGEAGAEGLSGLARAFFYAGSRALLVSHWYVDSEATAWLTRETAAALQARPDDGLAEALRTSMLAMLAGRAGSPYRHPIFWAPFVAVGEGA